jgi:hypothetical protein
MYEPCGLIEREIDLGILGKVTVELAMVEVGGALEVAEISVKGRPLMELDLLAQALGIHLDPRLFGELSSAPT